MESDETNIFIDLHYEQNAERIDMQDSQLERKEQEMSDKDNESSIKREQSNAIVEQ
jgi:hypothetical protein